MFIFDEEELQRGRKLVVKVFNAGRFVLINLKDFDPKKELKKPLEILDCLLYTSPSPRDS